MAASMIARLSATVADGCPAERVTANIAAVRPDDAAMLPTLARAFHGKARRTLDAVGAPALVAIAQGEPLARAWLVRDSDRPAGYLIITLGYSVEYGGRDGFIDDLHLVPEARGPGLGRRLLPFALAEAAQLGVRTLHLEVEVENERATRPYRAGGFEETGRRLMRRRIMAAVPRSSEPRR
jgi:ribosomal protein S18 acetylase RimI-like enzyme